MIEPLLPLGRAPGGLNARESEAEVYNAMVDGLRDLTPTVKLAVKILAGAVIGECAWCGAEIESKPKPPPGSTRGEIFCSVNHRDQSARAVKRLHEVQS